MKRLWSGDTTTGYNRQFSIHVLLEPDPVAALALVTALSLPYLLAQGQVFMG